MSIKQKLMQLKITPQKKLGQNFLNNEVIAKKIIQTFNVKKDHNIIEIGSGLGILTKFLMIKIKENNDQKLILIEKDQKLFNFLKNEFQKEMNIEFYNDDILEFNLQKLATTKKYQVISNLPYSIATAILFLFLQQRQMFSSLFFSFPEEIADKILASKGTKKYGFLTIMTQLFSLVEKKIILNKEYFYPLPKINSVFLEFIPKKKIIVRNARLFLEFIKNCFKYKRKTLLNNWKISYKLDTNTIKRIIPFLLKNNFTKKTRPETCTLNDFKLFFNYWEKIEKEK